MAQRRSNRSGSRSGSPAGGRPQRPATGAAGRPAGGGTPGTARDLAAQRTRLREIIEPILGEAGFYLEDLALSRAGRRHLVRLTVDGDEGFDLDAVAAASRLVSRTLDDVEEREGELLAGEYELQVSSPGVDRPLTEPRHWRRNIGRLVQVRAGDAGQLTGRVITAVDTGVVLDVAGTTHDLTYDVLGPGKVQLEFTRLTELAAEDVGSDAEFTDAEENWEEDEE